MTTVSTASSERDTAPTEHSLTLRGVSKTLGGRRVVADLDLTVGAGNSRACSEPPGVARPPRCA